MTGTMVGRAESARHGVLELSVGVKEGSAFLSCVNKINHRKFAVSGLREILK